MIAKRFKLLTVLGISFSLSVAANAQTITGAGASFPYPIYAKWAGLYEKRPVIKSITNLSVPVAVSNKLLPKQLISVLLMTR